MYECNRRSREICENIYSRENDTNIRLYSDYTIMKGNEVKSRAIKEAIREIDAEIDEKEYTQKKLRDSYNFYDIEARNSFTKSKVTISMIKCANGINPYGVHNNMINK